MQNKMATTNGSAISEQQQRFVGSGNSANNKSQTSGNPAMKGNMQQANITIGKGSLHAHVANSGLKGGLQQQPGITMGKGSVQPQVGNPAMKGQPGITIGKGSMQQPQQPQSGNPAMKPILPPSDSGPPPPTNGLKFKIKRTSTDDGRPSNNHVATQIINNHVATNNTGNGNASYATENR